MSETISLATVYIYDAELKRLCGVWKVNFSKLFIIFLSFFYFERQGGGTERERIPDRLRAVRTGP